MTIFLFHFQDEEEDEDDTESSSESEVGFLLPRYRKTSNISRTLLQAAPQLLNFILSLFLQP